ncbi:MAG: 4-(cytidine 5'-diphospho)-2-C-methyl-D-erythritol kinase [Bacilli bacterium]|nr:4-(cytidine 5'-diphospho)-2-C-methyl-D-erythritol kinase [Bacilli bacterium]
MKFKLFARSSEIKKSRAKINLSLRIAGVRDDGYHILEMINLPLELHDSIEVENNHGDETFVTCDDIGLSKVRGNLCLKAVHAMREKFHFKENFNIVIHKEIPFAAGLGGGSSNAAATMLAINDLCDLKASKKDLEEVALKLGADVPFFLQDKPCLVGGIGEEMSEINVKKSYICLLVKPIEGLSTKDVFSVAEEFDRAPINTKNALIGLAEGNDELIAESIGNDLYAPACKLLPKVSEVVEKLKPLFKIVSMSGSGSTVFALTDDAKKAKEAAKRFEAEGYVVRLTKTIKG